MIRKKKEIILKEKIKNTYSVSKCPFCSKKIEWWWNECVATVRHHGEKCKEIKNIISINKSLEEMFKRYSKEDEME